MSTPTVGVFALQGDVREHLEVLGDLGVRAIGVRRPAELEACDALVIPGGESTTMAKLARTFDRMADRLAQMGVSPEAEIVARVAGECYSLFCGKLEE